MAGITDTLIAGTREEWRAWLDQRGEQAREIWLLIGKKGSGVPSVTYAEAVEEALCYGWIDGLTRAWDEARYAVRFTPRRRGSVWAESNKDRVERMLAEGRMTERGMRLVEAAKAAGEWDRMPSNEDLDIVPDDLRVALDADAEAAAGFAALPPSARRLYVYWIGEATRDETRARRVAETVRRARLGLRFGQPG